MNDLQTLFEGYEIHLQAAGRRPSTVLWYRKHIGKFLTWLDQQPGTNTLDRIKALHIRKYITFLQNGVSAWESNRYVPTQERGLSSAYISGAVSALRAWFNWMEKEDYLADNPLRKVPNPKVRKRLIEPLEAEELKRLLKAISGTTPISYRNRAVVLTLLDTGLRVSELCQLEVEDVDLKGGWLRVQEGKGWQERKVPIGGALRRALWQYRAVRPEPMGGNKAFFLTERGWPVRPDRIRKMLLYYGRKADVADVHPHRFRHSFALHFLRHGGDPLTLRMLLGHSSLEMVNRYVRLAATDLKAAHAKASPADHLRL